MLQGEILAGMYEKMGLLLNFVLNRIASSSPLALFRDEACYLRSFFSDLRVSACYYIIASIRWFWEGCRGDPPSY